MWAPSSRKNAQRGSRSALKVAREPLCAFYPVMKLDHAPQITFLSYKKDTTSITL